MNLRQVLLLGSVVILTACGGGGDGATPSEDVITSPSTPSEDVTTSPSTFSSSLFVKSSVIAPGADCPNGGISVDSGLDTNNNKVLDSSEIVETQIVCNGIDGAAGNNGLNSLVSVIDEPIGANCGAGGKKVEIGLDVNADDILDSTEITSTQYVCHGLNGTGSGGTVDTNCTIVTGSDNSTILQCSDESVVLVPGDVTVTPTSVTPITGGYDIVDTWQSSGGRNQGSFRNPHYLIDVAQDGDINIDITANSRYYIYLLDSLGVLIGQEYNVPLVATVTAGTYTIVAATYTPNVSENYTLQILGSVGNIRKIASDYLSRTGSWVDSGGRNPKSFRNHHYTFTIERDTYLDVILNSSVGTSLYLINSQGILVTSYAGGALVGELHTKLPADSYTLIIATYNSGQTANYTLELYGQFADFTKVASNMLGFQNTWSNSGGRNPESFRNDHYSVTVINPTYLDVLIQSSVGTTLYLIDSSGFIVNSYGGGALNGQISQLLDPDIYTLVAATYSPNQAADYSLNFFGHFSSIIKRIPSPVTSLNDSWQNSAGRIIGSYRNDHYSFTADADTYVDILLTSSVGVSMYLIDSLGITQASYVSGALTALISTPISADTYTLVVATYLPWQTANYTLEMHGNYTNFSPIPGQTLTTTNAWANSGGAVVDSPNNPRYGVTVTQDSYIDVIIESAVANYLFLINDLGAIELKVSGNVLAGKVIAGNYTIIAATSVAGQTAPFNLTVVGQVANLVEQ